ncbi:FecCD family ABC transporter permease [Solicola gregarius]|uniref:Iron chelate uptake ABC transporter family permease subunit n=1 Tax=Solicola gregarius TaxID=2908642 RepID=A0AA46YJA7_9ACTN|nr:iron chelate uptake ABC transporter family permease subunit [Solicola gregarius]UYM04350.1 iron chelate uptake ABC transporter family permease subunit [Solicola gregarius]
MSTATTNRVPDRIDTHDAQRRRSRTVLIGGLVAAVAVLFVVALLSVFLGTRSISPGQIFDTFFQYDSENTDHLVVWTLRVPRTLAGILVGVALGLAGAVMQGVARNPLADPGLLGVNAGAALAVVCAISVLGVGSAMGYVWFAFVGAAVVAVAVYLIGSLGREGATPVKLALAGAAMTAALQSITTAILLTDVATFDKFRFWTVGSLSGRKLELVAQMAPFIVAGVVLALCTGRLLNALSLGDDVARGLGQRVALARGLSAAAVVLLCGAATALAGPITFLGLTIPHVARLITGPDYRWILPYSMVLAPILLLVSDIVGRLVAKPGELQVGIVMAIIGAPFFILLVRRRKLAEL